MTNLKKRPAKNMEVRNQVKDSKFYGSIFTVKDREEAEKRITEIKNKYSDASHNVSAFRVESTELDQDPVEYFDDDGEPSGSSGPPILEAIKGEDLLNTVIVVTRYFGGTKLGIGGLIRAYGDTARLAIKEAGVETLKEFYLIEVKTSFDKIGIVLGQLEALKAEIKNTEFNNQGAVVKSVIPTDIKARLKNILQEKTAADYDLKIIKSVFK
ncbi:putative YigZ family protein [Halanaerobium saccharolyticum]|uniref:Putative YigZ family protein n=1 Tax=Halanaerobium saccharolyticum TaxID=43595 RepID=A0A4R7Z387_9FIRM|nr:YigZ family protein [Halanaerobium saccharolyticum]RAK10384.1 putative YigZ family protein [Halanaerobium saccharolyticum]TDW05330.1 putative YigZ family protein [Halanaerobium saccharolyticum]TDX60400.1 putative YigZ family protein [Halanaerobium saccharolyticum]